MGVLGEPPAQAVVDALSVTLGRPVLLDDPWLVPIAYSRQWGAVDDVRRASILSRGADRRVREALLAQGIADARDVVRTQADPELEMDERICVTVRSAGTLLGYIWLLDPESTLSEDDLDEARAAARRVASLLTGPGARSVADESALLAELVSTVAERRAAAVAEVRARDLLPDGPVVLCLMTATAGEVDATAVVQHAVRRLSVRHAIGGRLPPQAAVLASAGDPVLRTLHAEEVAQWLHALSPSGVAVSQSAPTALDQLPDAARRARIALRVARSRSPASSFAAWSTLGADRLVAQLPGSWREDVPAGLTSLLREQPALARTLADFLEAGGDVKATAKASCLHRSGVYYRLRRIEELTGLDLNRGDDRLLAHLVLRAEHLW